jgi:hypothetical protein
MKEGGMLVLSRVSFNLLMQNKPGYSPGSKRYLTHFTKLILPDAQSHEHNRSVADPDPVGSGNFRSDPDPDLFGRIWIRILALIKIKQKLFWCVEKP